MIIKFRGRPVTDLSAWETNNLQSIRYFSVKHDPSDNRDRLFYLAGPLSNMSTAWSAVMSRNFPDEIFRIFCHQCEDDIEIEEIIDDKIFCPNCGKLLGRVGIDRKVFFEGGEQI